MTLSTITDKIRSVFTRNKIITTSAGSGITATNSYNYGYGSPYPEYGSGSKWPGGTSRGASINIHDHFSIRQQVRDSLYDSIEARALVKSIVDTSVDTGLRFKPTPDADILGITPEEAEAWAENVAQRFHMWAKSKKSHRPRINNFYQNQRLYMLFRQRDNDIFARLFYIKEKDTTNPLQIDFLEPNQIRGHAYTSTYAQLGGDDGIIRDKAGRETDYKIWIKQPDGSYKDVKIPARGPKSGRTFMLHGFTPEYAGQGRGMSLMTHLIQEFEDLTGFKASTIQKAINQASFIAAVENDQQDGSNPVVGRVAGPGVQQYGSNPTPTLQAQNVTQNALEPVVNWTPMPEATLHVPGSAIIGNLRRGDKMKYLQDTSPSAAYDKFVESFFSSIAASVGWSVELVLKKFNANYSASRGTLLLCWRTANIERDEMITDFLDPVYEMWLSEEIAQGTVRAPGWSDQSLKDAWLMGEWAGVPMPNIDPLKTMEADRGYVELGAQTLDDVARNFNGSSGKANRRKNARQYYELPTPPWPRAPIQQIPGAQDDG